MQDWSEGYVSDIGYTYGYYKALNHTNARLPLLNKGVRLPHVKNACELGFGQGISINLHAAASDCDYFGTDFSPTQVNFAKQFSKNSGAELYDESFEQFCKRTDLPKFDFISLHGIWSWISEENRLLIQDFFSNKLNVGGVVYISYNTYPGWSMFSPIRNLMSQHSEILGPPGGNSDQRVSNSLDFVQAILNTNPIYLQENPALGDKVDTLKKLNKSYLAHEYFNQNWKPDFFSEMAKVMESSKMEYVCSSRIFNQLNHLCFTQEQNTLLNSIENTTLRECVKDLIQNVQFRQEYWIKGSSKLTRYEQEEFIKNERVILTAPVSKLSREYQCPVGNAVLDENIFNCVTHLLADNEIHSIGELTAKASEKGMTLAQVLEVIIVFMDSDLVTSVQDDESNLASGNSCKLINEQIIQLSKSREDVNCLASPVTGGGIIASRIEQLILLGMSQGLEVVDDLANYVAEILESQGHAVVFEGKVIEGKAECVKQLKIMITEFLETKLPILKNLRVIS